MRMWVLRVFLKAGADPCLKDMFVDFYCLTFRKLLLIFFLIFFLAFPRSGSSCLDNLVLRGYEFEMNALAKEFRFQKV